VLAAIVKDLVLNSRLRGLITKDLVIRSAVLASGEEAWTIWDGTTEHPVTLLGVWDGTRVVAVTTDFA
jgi:hypothetical protein